MSAVAQELLVYLVVVAVILGILAAATALGVSHLRSRRQDGAEINPVYGDELQSLMQDIVNAPQSIKDKVKAVMPPR
jgi:hypothetical protein